MSSYFIGINTGVTYKLDDYKEAADQLVNMLSTVLTDSTSLADITHNVPFESGNAEIQVSLEPIARELVAEAVLDMRGDKVPVDKGRLSKLLKASQEAQQWPSMQISKKRVPA